MKKLFRYASGLLSVLLLCSFLGCAKQNVGAPTFTSDWELSQITTNGTTNYYEDESFLVKVVTNSKNPKFKSSDGYNCVFTMNGKDHAGTLSEQNGMYKITYSDTSKPMYAKIDGDKLYLTNENNTFEIVFRAKK